MDNFRNLILAQTVLYYGIFVSVDKWDKWVKLDIFVDEDRWRRWVKQDKRKTTISSMDKLSDFERLHLYLVNLTIEYGCITARKFETAKQKKLTFSEIKNIVDGENNLIKTILSDPKTRKLVATQIKQEYRKIE